MFAELHRSSKLEPSDACTNGCKLLSLLIDAISYTKRCEANLFTGNLLICIIMFTVICSLLIYGGRPPRLGSKTIVVVLLLSRKRIEK